MTKKWEPSEWASWDPDGAVRERRRLEQEEETGSSARDPKAEQAAIDAGQVDELGGMTRYDVSWQQGLMRL